MFELIPSGLMRDFYKEKGFEFTDFQKATLIWNAPKKRQEIIYALRELAETTEDERTRKQIFERIDFEKKLFDAFINNQGSRYVYVVEDEQGYARGFFHDYYQAVEYALKNTLCSIQKQLIIKTKEDEIVRNPWRGNPNLGFEASVYEEYRGNAVAGASLDIKGEIESLWSSELTGEEENLVDEYRSDRFEYQFIKLPFDLAIGTPVKDVVSGTYGILAQGKEEWDKYLQNIEDRKLHVDFSDVQVIIFRLTETGYWTHEHINPMHLEIEFPPYIQDDEKRKSFRRAMEAFSDYLSYKSRGKIFHPELVLKYAREYAAICHEKSHWEKIVENAKDPEELMW